MELKVLQTRITGRVDLAESLATIKKKEKKYGNEISTDILVLIWLS